MKQVTLSTVLLLSLITSQAFGQKQQAEASVTTFKSSLDRWQIMLAQVSPSMTSKEVDSTTQQVTSEKKMSGNNLGIYFEIIKSRNEYFEWLAHAGYEVFSVSSKESLTYCPSGSTEVCNVEISYLSLGLMPKLKWSRETFQIWTGGGLNVKQPLTKKATAVLLSEIQTTSTYGIALGVDVFVGEKLILPFEVQQQYFFNSDSVEARQILFKVGLGRVF